ncbi:MAG: tetratricopeptide repeat protein [Anaerolineaceae bacterium]|nr:tetratricopeptide repeat protein [Anaerolineaceae bacterium]
MAKISLRAYIREIESLIDRGQIEEAIAHCKCILKTYPKHVDTYRLLGKAHLESQRYGEASDVLQRVLSVIPEDFVSHIGLSIIREDEGNLDAAIWHMERAFEVQPSNAAIQDELKRLYGRRDGIQPPKVRLTRGALVRMYYRGELYPQAIAEVQASIAEDPNRIDLEVLLARIYFKAGQKVEAAQVSSKLIKKLPYCYEINKILASLLPETSKPEDAKTYQQRIFAIEPYAAHVTKNTPSTEQVPDNVITIERLEWSPSLMESQSPVWAQSAGINFEQQESQPGDWMTDLETPGEKEENFSTELSDDAQTTDFFENKNDEANEDVLSPPQETIVPEWMKNAGWDEQSITPEEIPTDSITASLETTDSTPFTEEPPIGKGFEIEVEDAQPTEIPEWLQSMAPENSDLESDVSLIELETEAVTESSEEETLSTDAFLDNVDLPEWLSDIDTGSSEKDDELHAPETIEQSPIQEQAVEDFLLPDDSKLVEDSEIDDSKFENFFTEPLEQVKSDLENLQTLEIQPEPLADSEPEKAEAKPDWLDLEGLGKTEETVPDKGDMPLGDPSTPNEANLAEDIDVNNNLLDPNAILNSIMPERTIETAFPEWIPDVELETKSEIPTPTEELKWDTEPIEEPLLDETEKTLPPQDYPSEEDMDAGLAFLEYLAQKQGAEPSTLSTPMEERNAPTPEWLLESIEDEEKELDSIPQSKIAEEASTIDVVEIREKPLDMPSEFETPTPEELDAGLAWMESLAANQGADPETLSIPEGQREEQPPDWIKDSLESTVPDNEEKDFDEEEPLTIGLDFVPPERVSPPEVSSDLKIKSSQSDIESMKEDIDAGLQWLQDSAIDQPKPEIPIVTVPNQTADSPPDWLMEYLDDNNETEISHVESQIPQISSPTLEIDPVLGDNLFEEKKEVILSDEKLPGELKAELISPEDDPLALSNSFAVLESIAEGNIPQEEAIIKTEFLAENQEKEEITSKGQPLNDELVSHKEVVASIDPIETSIFDQPLSTSEQAVEMPKVNDVAAALEALHAGNLQQAIVLYENLIEKGENLHTIIAQLEDSIYTFPVDVSIWQTLGDAYAKDSQLQKALDAYSKAESLLR